MTFNPVNNPFAELQAQILWRIASGVPLPETLEELARALDAATPGTRAAVLPVEYNPAADEAPRLGKGASPGMGDAYRDGMARTYSPPDSPCSVVLRGGVAIHIPDCATDPRYSPAARESHARHGIGSCHLRPLRDRKNGAVIGVFCLYGERQESVASDVSPLHALGMELAALAISRANVEKARQCSEAELETLYDNLRVQACVDPLTGLANRTHFMQLLARALADAENFPAPARPAVLFVDLDRFKLVNDTLGHAAGDRLLQAMAERFLSVVGGSGTVARLGGDEFVILLPRVTEADALGVAERVHAAAAKPAAIHGQESFVGASVGVALWKPRGVCTAAALLQNADTAMYHAKKEGGRGFALFTRAMGEAAQSRASLEADLHRALANGELSLVFQPQFDLVTGRMIGAEVLARWQHPSRGSVPPGDFIPIAEESGLIEPIGEWILREACNQGALWQRSGWPLRLSVNLSARQFAPRNRLVDQVERVLAETGFAPQLLDLEITESILLARNIPVLETLAAFKRLGVRLLLDDFGTGYGSLIYLRQFPLDVLKVDRSFIAGLSETREDAAIVRAVIDLAHALGMQVIAEGVETDDQRAELSLLGCDALQGYLWSPPVPASGITAMLAQTAARAAVPALGRGPVPLL